MENIRLHRLFWKWDNTIDWAGSKSFFCEPTERVLWLFSRTMCHLELRHDSASHAFIGRIRITRGGAEIQLVISLFSF
jgi:hypothetical protein